MKTKPKRWRFSYSWALSYLDIVILSTLMIAGFFLGVFDRLIGRHERRSK